MREVFSVLKSTAVHANSMGWLHGLHVNANTANSPRGSRRYGLWIRYLGGHSALRGLGPVDYVV